MTYVSELGKKISVNITQYQERIKNLTILQVAKMFKNDIKFLPQRLGERYSSELVKMNLSKEVINYTSSKKLKEYINDFKKNLIN